MRLFVSFQDTVHSLDVDIRETVGDIKNTLGQRFGLNLKNHRNETDQFVSLVYQGSNLQDDWVYSDLGIPPGSSLVCSVEKQIEPTLTVHCINYDEKIEYKVNFNVWDATIGTLRGMVQDSTGIHVSAFRLFSKTGLELFDCHPLKVYGIDTGDTVTMEIWRDVADVVHAARDNDITDTLGSLASFQDGPHLMRYQLQLGLFTAAHYGYHQLATQLMKCGARPDEPVGQHPSRDWCRASAHVDHVKTPAHEAAQHGRLKCLQHFLMFNYAVLICKDANGLTPCNIARRYKQTECFKLLVAEQFRIPSVHPALSVHVYSRVRKWCDRARMRARLHKDKTAMLLLTNAEVSQKCAVVGQKVEVDGFNGLERVDRLVKSAPSGLNTSIEKMKAESKSHSATVRGNLQSNQSNSSNKKVHTNSLSISHGISRGNMQPNHWTYPLSRGKADINPSYNPLSHRNAHAYHLSDPSSEIQRTNSDVSSQGNFKAGHSNTTLASYDKSKRQDSNVQQKNGELYRRPMTQSVRTTSFMTPRVSRTGHTTPRVLTRGERKVSFAGETHREPTLPELGNSVKRQNSRYIWKSFDDVRKESQDNLGTLMDKRCQTRTSVIDDQHDPVKSNDIPNSSDEILAESHRKLVGSYRETHGSTLGNSRDKIGEDRQEVTSILKRQSVASIGTYNARKEVTPSKSGSVFEEQADSPVKLRSAHSRDSVYHGAVESNADKCLRVACETFRKKSWLGQLQMALVVNTNMCRRR